MLLSCFITTERHTAENIANQLKAVLTEWKVWHKVVAIVSDNAANMVMAITDHLKKHVPCFAHTLNLAVQDAIRMIDVLHTKVKDKGSTLSSNTLKETQQRNGPILKLKQAMPTRWNSSHHMFKRMLEVRIYKYILL